MNKFVILFVFAFAYVHAEGESSSSEEDLKALLNVVQGRFISINSLLQFINRTEEKCPDIEEKFDAVADEVDTCMESIELGDQTFCSLFRNNFERCAEPIRKLFDGCVPEESKGIPKLGIKIIKSIVAEACNSTVEQLLELFNPCVTKKDFESFDTCIKVKEVVTSHRDTLPSKSLLCSTLPKIKSCLTSHREASCKNPVTKEAGINFFEAVDQATEADCQAINEA